MIRSHHAAHPWTGRLLSAIAICVWLSASANAQVIIRTQPATAYSAAIFAQSDYLRAQGDFLTSAASARSINADAASKEMKNSVEWVKTYFERRRLNREARAIEEPSFLDRLEIRRKAYHRLLKENPDAVLSTDVTDELNYMVKELLGHSSYEMFMPTYPGSLYNTPENVSLTPSDIRHLRLSEGKLVGGKSSVFRADTAQPLETRWPRPLRAETFDAERTEFERVRDESLAQLKSEKKLSRENEERLMQAVDRLADALTTAYPRERQNAFDEFRDFKTSKMYLQTLALATVRLIETQSEIAFDDSYRFQGNNLVELLQHLMKKGLEFAPAEPGDEATYKHVFRAVRALYLKAIPDPNSASNAK